MRAIPIIAALAMTLGSCGVHAAGTSAGAGNMLTAEQMLATGAESVYEAVERLRPEWLRSRGPVSLTDSSPAVPSIFIGGSHVGDVEQLRSLRIDDVSHIRYYEPGEAGVRYGMGHPRGVIDVVMKGAQR